MLQHTTLKFLLLDLPTESLTALYTCQGGASMESICYMVMYNCSIVLCTALNFLLWGPRSHVSTQGVVFP
ncbi:hypothetical protein BDV36DRAFT_275319, partial [Aspergillus pseudocaelatus]